MFKEANPDPVRQNALAGLINSFLAQGLEAEQAKWMATSIIFQADLDLRNAQMARLLNWLQQEHNDIYSSAVAVVEKTREEFENRVKQG